MIPEPTLVAAGPVAQAYESRLLNCLKTKQVYPRPSLELPRIMRAVGFKQITRCQMLFPIFWRDLTEPHIAIRNRKTGEICNVTMSEIGDRVSSLLLGFWEEKLGDWDDDVEDIGTRNKLRRKEMEQSKSYNYMVKVWARKGK
jgi:hypothetical protein